MIETDKCTVEMTKHTFCACPNKSVNQGNMLRRNFINVIRNKEDSEDNKDDN